MLTVSDFAKLIGIVAVWGFSFVAVKLGVTDSPPLFAAALRFLFAAVPAVFILKRPKVPLVNLLAYGIFLGVVQFGLLYSAIRLGLPAGLASLVIQLQVFFTIFFAAVLLRDRPSFAQIAGAVVAFAGVAVIGSERVSGAQFAPLLMVIGAGAAWAGANIASKTAGNVDMLAFVAFASMAAPLPLLALSFLIDGPEQLFHAILHPTFSLYATAAILGWVATDGAFGMWSRMLARYPVPVVAPFPLLVPVFGFLGTWVVFAEPVTFPEAAGGVIILAGLIINVFWPFGMARRTTRRAASKI